jgi:hypothetical protein
MCTKHVAARVGCERWSQVCTDGGLTRLEDDRLVELDVARVARGLDAPVRTEQGADDEGDRLADAFVRAKGEPHARQHTAVVGACTRGERKEGRISSIPGTLGSTVRCATDGTG